MNAATTQLVREHIKGIVTRGLDEYGSFPVQEDEVRFYRVAVDLLLAVTSRIESRDVVTLDPLKPMLVSGVFTLNFDVTRSIAIFGSIANSLYKELEDNGLADPDTVREYQKYEALLFEVIGDVRKLLTESTAEYLNGIEAYGIAEKTINLPSTSSRLLRINRNTDVSPARSRLSGKFTDVFAKAVDSRAQAIVQAAKEINEVISDSKIPEPLGSVNTDLLVATFAGEGKKVYADAEKLYNFSVEFGGYEGSIVGAVDYQARYYEYLMAMSYGKVLPQGVLEGSFGDFEQIYGYRSTQEGVPGLKFLETLYTTRSANQTVGPSTPVASRYGVAGVTDRYVFPQEGEAPLDFVSLALEAVYVLCLKAGDTIASIRRPGFSLQASVLAKIFPASNDAAGRTGGMTGAVGRLLKAHRALFALTGYNPDLGEFSNRFRELSGLLSELTQTLRTAGFRPGSYVPSLDLTYYEPDKGVIADKLAGLGFSQAETQNILSATNFTELLDRFAPLTDSQDVISFFRAFDLTKLLYEFGGQQAIDQYIEFLYGNQPVIRLLELLDVNRTLTSKVAASNYSKLIGYLVPLTYAVDPEQLVDLDSVLRRNNLDLFESISLLVKQGVPTVVKDKDSVSMLSGMVAQMVGLPSYASQQPLWNQLIAESAGNVGTDIAGVYDRAEGITPTELYTYLNGPSATSPLGQLLDGVRGGRMTSLLRYCNLFGLLYTLSPYRNSGQLVNKSAEEFSEVLSLLDTFEALSERLYVAYLILQDQGRAETPVYTDPIVQAQNKEFSALASVLADPESFDPDLYEIAESPGIGNARIPNGIRISNSLLPEEAALIATRGAEVGIFTQQASQVEDSGYLKVAVSNLLASGISVESEASVTESTTVVSPVQDYSISYRLPVATDGLSPASAFDPLASCQRFGNTNCADKGYDVSDLCSKNYNKSLFPETGYGQDPAFTAGTNVPIDRPLGSGLTRDMAYASVPTDHPQQPFTVSGLTDLSRTQILKDSEMLCAGFKDPFEYGACMNLLKCKRFKPPTSGRFWLEFCPSTLQGGRFRP